MGDPKGRKEKKRLKLSNRYCTIILIRNALMKNDQK